MTNKVDFFLNENGMFESVKVNGKPIKKSFANALKTAQATNIWYTCDFGDEVVNPYTEVCVTLNMLELSIYEWIRNADLSFRTGYGFQTIPISLFDNMRYLFLDINPDAYYDLID